MSYVFKLAENPEEYDGLRRLNHRVFAEEVGQHTADPSGLLVDRFESKSEYWIALHAGAVVGMLAVHDQPPYSVEKRLPTPDVLKSWPSPILEVRLLAVDPDHRNRMVMAGLLGNMVVQAMDRGYATMLASGITGRLEMYRRFGFEELGPPVEDGRAAFVPLALRLDQLPARIRHEIGLWLKRGAVS